MKNGNYWLRNLALAVMIFYFFHIARNLTSLYFVLLGGVVAIFFVAIIYNQRINHFDPWIFAVFLFWIYAAIISLFQSNRYGDPEMGIIRMWVSVPLLPVGVVLSSASIKIPMRFFSIFFALAALSLGWQYAFGAIYWFAEASARSGGDRFASLAGSLTSYGIFVGVAVLAAFMFFKGVQRALILALLMTGAILSLQKAGLANIALGFFLAFWIGALRFRWLVVVVALGLIYAFVHGLVSVENGVVGLVHRHFVGVFTSDMMISGDVGFFESIVDRFTTLPSELLTFYGADSLIFGVGVFGGSGALGYPELPMAHNGLVEVLIIFGFFVGGLLIFPMLSLFIWSLLLLRRRRQIAGSETAFLCAAYVIWFVNYIFSGGGLFHPIGASIFWLVVLRIRRLKTQFIPRTSGQVIHNDPVSHFTAIREVAGA